jgi:hypothetical protein
MLSARVVPNEALRLTIKNWEDWVLEWLSKQRALLSAPSPKQPATHDSAFRKTAPQKAPFKQQPGSPGFRRNRREGRRRAGGLLATRQEQRGVVAGSNQAAGFDFVLKTGTMEQVGSLTREGDSSTWAPKVRSHRTTDSHLKDGFSSKDGLSVDVWEWLSGNSD